MTDKFEARGERGGDEETVGGPDEAGNGRMDQDGHDGQTGQAGEDRRNADGGHDGEGGRERQSHHNGRGRGRNGSGSQGRADDGDYNGKHRTNPFAYCLSLGFFAGLIGGLLRWLLHAVHFTKVLPGFMADPFFRKAFLHTGWGHAVGIGCFIIFSIAAALLYKLVLGRLGGPWPGVAYGLAWWLLLFLAIGPTMDITPTIRSLGYDSLFTEVSVFLMWGLFIGYTIAFEYNDEASREPLSKKAGMAKAGS